MHRDAAIVRFGDGYIVHTCDSVGGVGSLEYDNLKVEMNFVALVTLKVALVENLSLGARPLSVGLSFCNSSGYVASAIDLVKKFLGEKFTDVDIVVSTEKNFPTVQTGMGVSVVGFARSLRVGGAAPGYGVYLLGTPLVGVEYLQRLHEAMEFDDLVNLLKLSDVGEVIPVGSKGVLREAELLAENSGLRFVPDRVEHWLGKSAGPATCAVFYSKVQPELPKIRRIGILL